MLDKMISFGAEFDWITGLFGRLDWRMVGLSVPAEYQTWVDSVFEQYGVELHYTQIVDGDYVFSVRRQDYNLAYALIDWLYGW